MRNRTDNETSGSDGLPYHYNREERLAMAPGLRESCYEEGSRPRGLFGGIFRQNRGLVFLLLDVLLLIIIFIVYSVLSAGGDSGWTKDGVRFDLAAFAYEDKAFVSLRITRRAGAAASGSGPRVVLGAQEESSEPFSPALPAGEGESVFVRAVFARPASMTARGIVLFGGETRELSVRVKGE